MIWVGGKVGLIRGIATLRVGLRWKSIWVATFISRQITTLLLAYRESIRANDIWIYRSEDIGCVLPIKPGINLSAHWLGRSVGDQYNNGVVGR